MRNPERALGALVLVGAFALALIPATSGVAVAQQAADDPESAAPASPEEAEAEPLTEADRKRAAKEARIAEYLRKKEERRAERARPRTEADTEREEAAVEPPEAPAPEARRAATEPPRAAAESKRSRTKLETRSAPKPKPERTRRLPALPRDLKLAQNSVRRSAMGQDATVEQYLALVDEQEASAYELAALANFIAQNGLAREALAYYGAALKLERDDPVLWVNVGTLHRQLREQSEALSAYNRALNIDANNALAHYNLGAIFDEQGKYEESIAEYRAALTIDPTLGDPRINPQAANNDRLLAVKLMLYREQSGSRGLPLVDVQQEGKN
jgi:tetratricopeptide (TPR) repeat protein